MNDLNLSQTEPISSLPRNYASLVARANKEKKPIVFLKRNQPVVALLDWEEMKKLMALKVKSEEQEALKNIAQSEKESRFGKAKILRSLTSLG